MFYLQLNDCSVAVMTYLVQMSTKSNWMRHIKVYQSLTLTKVNLKSFLTTESNQIQSLDSSSSPWTLSFVLSPWNEGKSEISKKKLAIIQVKIKLTISKFSRSEDDTEWQSMTWLIQPRYHWYPMPRNNCYGWFDCQRLNWI